MSEYLSLAIVPRGDSWYATIIVRETVSRNGRPRTLGQERAIYIPKAGPLDVQAACAAIRDALEAM